MIIIFTSKNVMRVASNMLNSRNFKFSRLYSYWQILENWSIFDAFKKSVLVTAQKSWNRRLNEFFRNLSFPEFWVLRILPIREFIRLQSQNPDGYSKCHKSLRTLRNFRCIDYDPFVVWPCLKPGRNGTEEAIRKGMLVSSNSTTVIMHRGIIQPRYTHRNIRIIRSLSLKFWGHLMINLGYRLYESIISKERWL